MTQNVLLSKSEFGKVKPGFHVLPSNDYVYGKAPIKDQYGTRQAISNWEFHKPSGIAQPPKNFMQINKQGLSAGYTNSKDLSRFKDANDTRVKVVQGKKTVKKELPYSDIVFGIKNRPSTPINNVICNTYAQQSAELAKQREAVMKLLDQKQPIRPDLAPKSHNKYSNRKQQIAQNNFKLSKFNNVQSKIKPMMQADRKKKEEEQVPKQA